MLSKEEARDHEPDIVGEIPRWLNTKVLYSPRIDIIYHKYMEWPIRFTAMTLHQLVEAWALTTKENNELPKEEDHEYV